MRAPTQILSELTDIHSFILKGLPDTDINVMMQTMSVLVTYLASSSSLYAEAKFHHNQAKRKAYLTLKASSEANKQYYSPALAKDYISACCADEQYISDFADRVNSSCVHGIDGLRSILSAEKQLLSNLK